MRVSRISRFASAAIALCAFSAYSTLAAEMPTIENAWVAAAPPGVKVHAGYFTLHNLSSAQVDLVGVSSPQYERAEFHETRVASGVANMVRQEQISIPAGGVLKMAPGGFHIMLMNSRAPVKQGDTVDMQLTFADGATLSFGAPVRKSGQDASQMHHHHEHKTH